MNSLHRNTQTYTTTETITLPVTQTIPEAPIATASTERGRVLDRETTRARAHVQNPEQEAAVIIRFQQVAASAREQRINLLLTQLQDLPLPEELRTELNTRTEELRSVPQNTPLNRALVLAIILHRVIRPAIRVTGMSREQRLHLLALEDACRGIVQLLIPRPNLVNVFLDRCDTALRDERTFRKLCEHVQAFFNELSASLEASAEEGRRLIDQARESIGASLEALRASQTEVQRLVEERTEALEQQAERQRTQLLAIAGQLDNLVTHAHVEGFENSLQECKNLMQKIIKDVKKENI